MQRHQFGGIEGRFRLNSAMTAVVFRSGKDDLFFFFGTKAAATIQK